ncbi:MAG: glycosyltransferase family 4 protein [Marmoricola sp.]
MRILHVSDVYRPSLGGIELFVEELAHRQRAAGHDVSVLTRTPGADTLAGPVQVHRAPATGVLGDIDLTAFDAVHAHLSVWSPTTSRAIGAAGRRGVPVVATVHSMWDGWKPAVRLLLPLVGRSPLVWTAVSRAAALDMAAVLGDTPVHVVPNAVDVGWWRAGARSRRNDVLTLVAVMRLASRKRPMQLMELFGEVVRAVPEARPRLVVAGDGPFAGPMRDWARDHHLEARVLLTGPLSRAAIRDLHGASDVFVGPAHQESFGIAALEARAAGVPVVAMASGGVGEFVRDGLDGRLCLDDDAMLQALVGLARDRVELAAMQRHCAAVAPDHDWSHALDGFAACYDRAATTARPARSSRIASPVG